MEVVYNMQIFDLPKQVDHWISRCHKCGAVSELVLPILCGECGTPMVRVIAAHTSGDLGSSKMITKVLKPKEFTAFMLVVAWRGILGTAKAEDSLLDLNQRLLDFLIEEGILG